MSSDEAQDIIEADSIAYSSAVSFKAWGNTWIDAAVLAREFGTDYRSVLSMRKGNWIEVTDTVGMIKLAYISEIKAEGNPAPLEFSAPMIRDMIVSARKQVLISDLERDLLEDARENGKFVIFR